MGSHEVSEALVSKRATREAEREEMGYRGEPRGGAEAQRRKTHHAAPRPGRTRVGDEPAVGSIVPSDVAAAVTAGGGTAGQRKQSVRTESEAPARPAPQAEPARRGRLPPASGSPESQGASRPHQPAGPGPRLSDYKLLPRNLTQEAKGTHVKLSLKSGCLRSRRAVRAHVCVLGDGCAGSPFLTWQGLPRGQDQSHPGASQLQGRRKLEAGGVRGRKRNPRNRL